MPQQATEIDTAALPVLCVDLDGTLVKSDTLHDSALAVARHHPLALLNLPSWLLQGKAALKRHLAATVQLDVAHLPYNRELLQYLQQQHSTGRPIYLATAADADTARRVAAHLGFFTGVLASDGQLNLAGKNKLAAFRSHFGDNFTYIGNAMPDLPLLESCREPMVANPTPALRTALRKAGVTPARTFDETVSPLKAWPKAIRLHQWAKNVLIFLPLLLAHAWAPGVLAAAAIAFLSFGLCASATYIVNDLLDLEADRQHPRKRRRPFASGDLSALSGVIVVILLLAASLVLALSVPRVIAALSPQLVSLIKPHYFLEWLGIYLVTTLAYSLRFKRSVLVDVIVLSGLYTIRIIAGSAASGVPVSTWLGSFSIFFFLSLALVKRFAELENLSERGGSTVGGRGYHVSDIEQLRSFGSASGFASVVVLTLYISTLDAAQLYQHTRRLWLLVPVLILWIMRLWLLASRGQLNEDPVVYAITDRRSLLMGVLVALIVLSAL
ncbi:UbiA family prenyltransferase [Tunturibacter empetritectus]|uniref:4-hydroxybenzoate polyprenyltransferase n=1 Tax=Tunturiibacter lichenicola TaxID=2051959 RepID=A0A7W8J677_9BACT|nr:UbiA family prenyltransferase [Edaphobacter lichenicola]MBB5343410.1 4-hydroxybenzoate polyprenyltransferase [Edaphobacter lichenicola]